MLCARVLWCVVVMCVVVGLVGVVVGCVVFGLVRAVLLYDVVCVVLGWLRIFDCVACCVGLCCARVVCCVLLCCFVFDDEWCVMFELRVVLVVCIVIVLSLGVL